MKACKRCGETKPLDDFYRNARMRDGHLNNCKPCVLDADRTRYRMDGEAKRAYQREYARANAEKVAASKRLYNAANAEAIAERRARYNAANAEHRREYFAKYRRENPDVFKMHNLRRKVRERGTFVVDVSDSDKADKLAAFGGLCVYCGGNLSSRGVHWDHWKPLSKGGLHMLSNLYPACPPCNLSKSAKWPYRPPKNYSMRGVAMGEGVPL